MKSIFLRCPVLDQLTVFPLLLSFLFLLQVRLVRSEPPSAGFRDTLLAEHELYVRYQQAIHGDQPEDCDLEQFKRFLVESPLIVSVNVALSDYQSFSFSHLMVDLASRNRSGDLPLIESVSGFSVPLSTQFLMSSETDTIYLVKPFRFLSAALIDRIKLS